MLGDEISVSPGGTTVYFARGHGCHPEIESVLAGGSPTPITRGSVPAISPDGSKLAYTTQTQLLPGCVHSAATYAASFRLVIRPLSSGTATVIGLPPALVTSGLVPPISHLSWARNGSRLAVSVAPVQDNEGWSLNIVDPSAARYSVAGAAVAPAAGVTVVPVTGQPTPRVSYISEGIFLPDGDLFISRACCGGIPPRNTSRLMWEVAPSGSLAHQVALGFRTLAHTSLAVNPTGQWLLYLAGNGLFVSDNGGVPRQLTSGLIAATWG